MGTMSRWLVHEIFTLGPGVSCAFCTFFFLIRLSRSIDDFVKHKTRHVAKGGRRYPAQTLLNVASLGALFLYIVHTAGTALFMSLVPCDVPAIGVWLGEGNAISWKVGIGTYVAANAGLYVFLYLKQKTMWESLRSQGIRDLMDAKEMKMTHTLQVLLLVGTAGYCTTPFLCGFVLIHGKYDAFGNCTGAWPVWLPFLLAFADTGLSLVCLKLFLLPLAVLRKTATMKSVDTTLKHTMMRNRAACSVAVGSTFVEVPTVLLAH